MAQSGNVAGGLKATISNPKVSQEAKDNARERLENEEFDYAEDTSSKNPGNVAGGYKATLKNPNVGEEAKQNAEQKLQEMGEKV